MTAERDTTMHAPALHWHHPRRGLIEAGVQEIRYLSPRMAEHIGALAFYVRTNGRLLTDRGHGTCITLVRRGERLDTWANLPAQFAGYLQLGHHRLAVTPEQVQALEAEMARVSALELGQAIAARDAAQHVVDLGLPRPLMTHSGTARTPTMPSAAVGSPRWLSMCV
ncbi:hypothetical protein [Deinococcus multiflagellatus]|uniref:Uncharacterized protein n=1 Tax=Deinococcus multiflagellatus TaxID=1656887 RepID=A0ABW1ZQC9_9DEIO